DAVQPEELVVDRLMALRADDDVNVADHQPGHLAEIGLPAPSHRRLDDVAAVGATLDVGRDLDRRAEDVRVSFAADTRLDRRARAGGMGLGSRLRIVDEAEGSVRL